MSDLPTLPAAYVADVARCLQITHHTGGATSPWMPTIEQIALWEAQEAHPWVYVAKSRQTGITTASLLSDLLWVNAADTAGHTVTCAVVIDTDAKGLDKMRIVSDWCAQLGLEVRCLTDRVTWPNGSVLTYVSAHVDEPARSGSIHRLHLTELPFWRNPSRAYTSLMQSLALGCGVTIETTIAPSRDTLAKDLWHGTSQYHRVFLPVEMHEEYRSDPLSISDEEWARLQSEGFTRRDSAAWFAWAVANKCGGDEVRAFREYPQRPEHMFQHAEGRWIMSPPRVIDPIRTIDVTGSEPWSVQVWREPSEGGRVVIGVDTATGKGQDNSAIAVLDHRTGALVASLTSDTITIDDLALCVRACSDAYTLKGPVFAALQQPHLSRPPIHVESNGIGNATLQACYRLGLSVVDVVTTEGSRYEGLLEAKRKIEAGVVYGPMRLADECYELRRDDLGRWQGSKDLVMACGFALRAIKEAPIVDAPVRDREKFDLANRIASQRRAWRY